MSSKRPEPRYLVGYKDGARTVWGRGDEGGKGHVNTMPLLEATRKAEALPSQYATRMVFKLVPVVTVEPPKAQAKSSEKDRTV